MIYFENFLNQRFLRKNFFFISSNSSFEIYSNFQKRFVLEFTDVFTLKKKRFVLEFTDVLLFKKVLF